MISANYVDGLELRIRELTAERDAALAQNAELVAQVEHFKLALKNSNKEMRIAINARVEAEVLLSQLVRVPVSFKGIVPITVEDYDKAIKTKLESYVRMKDSDWHQHLRDIQAESGRAGFVAGVDALEVAQILGADFDAENSANQYAERVKAGEV